MKKRLLVMLALFTMAVGASAQIQLLYTDFGRNVIDRNKKLFWMDGDSDPCFDIQSYKKGGNKEVFVISERKTRTTNTRSPSFSTASLRL